MFKSNCDTSESIEKKLFIIIKVSSVKRKFSKIEHD